MLRTVIIIKVQADALLYLKLKSAKIIRQAKQRKNNMADAGVIWNSNFKRIYFFNKEAGYLNIILANFTYLRIVKLRNRTAIDTIIKLLTVWYIPKHD